MIYKSLCKKHLPTVDYHRTAIVMEHLCPSLTSTAVSHTAQVYVIQCSVAAVPALPPRYIELHPVQTPATAVAQQAGLEPD